MTDKHEPLLESDSAHDAVPASPALGYASASELMAHGPHALHEHVAARMECALGQSLPQVEVRFKNLSLGADLVVADEDETKAELPTIANHLRKKYGKCGKKKAVVRRQILKNVSGVFKPGTMTLILGQPGSGKSSLLKVLSGRFPMDKNVVLEGEVQFNGTPQAQLARKLPQVVSYVTQRDTHFPMLSVRETLEFAHTFSGGAALAERMYGAHFCNGSDEENRVALEASRAMAEHMPELVVQQLGLDNCANTIVGDAMLRGISGGERKRVTTGEMEFGSKFVCLMDEISTGLDSAATFDIINTQRSMAKSLRKTVVISLLQPAPEVFELFDYVLLLHDGEVLYHGPREDVVEYFASLGFSCPKHRDVADFLVDLSTDEQRQYEVAVPGGDAHHPRLPREFAERFTRSRVHEQMLAELHAPVDPALIKDAENHLDPLPEFHQSFWASTATLMRRQVMVTVRNKAFLRGKAVLLVLMGLLYASVFWQFKFEDVQVVMGIIFFAIMYLALAQTPMLPVYFAARDVFYKQRRANFYRTSSYVVSMSVSQIPLTVVESLVFGSFIYWMCGFVDTVGAYLLFEVLLFLTNLAFSAFFFYIACATTDVHVAKPLAMTSLLIAILFAGFVVTRNQLPDYFIWLYWLDPISWGIRSLAISQYRNGRFDTCIVDGFDYCKTYGMNMGEYYLSFFDIQTDKSWIYYGVIFNIVIYFVCMGLAYYALEFKRIETPENLSPPTRKEILAAKEGTSTGNYQELSTPKPDGGKDGVGADETHVSVTHAREKNFVPVTVAFQDLWYTVPDPEDKKASKDLLKGISGFALPGKMTALMGASGAGKTTLMDVIAGRKTGGKARGQILLNGFPATDLAIRRSTGYCEQMDIHSDSATIREALTFSAFLRQGSDVPNDKKYDSVNECLELLDLNSIADHCIRGCTVEQLKRLTIGVELAAQPSVIFLDEPTSGLDARAAKVIMDGVRKVADTGRTILCTIHQPSTEVFMLFDSLLLLKRGGETVFFGDLGPRAQHLIDYFESVPDVPKIEEGYNPATWMLEVIGAGVDSGKIVQVDTDFVEHFNASPLKVQMDADLQRDGVTTPASGESALAFSAKRASSSATQAQMIVQRFFRMYWRIPTYSWTRMAVNIFMGVLFGLVFLGANYSTYQEVNSGLGMVFCTTAFLGIVALNSAVPVASQERASFYRERASQTYNSFWYFIGFTVAEIPYTAIASLLFSVIFYPMAGFTGVDRAAFYWLNMTLHVLCQVYLGQLLSFAMPSVEVAALLGVLFNSIFVLFMGFNPPASSIPHNYKWLFDITPQRYSLMLFSAYLFGECSDEQLAEVMTAQATNATIDMSAYPAGCQLLEGAPDSIGNIPIRSYLDAVFDIRYSDIGYYMTINIIMIVALRVLALLSLRFINHQKK